VSTPSTLTVKRTCEGHPYIGVPCGGEAKFTLYRCGRVQEVCEPFARHIWRVLIPEKARCYQCRRRIDDHWHMEKIA
jgi:hypothetical protein